MTCRARSRFGARQLDYGPLRKPDVDWAILVPKIGEGVQLAIDKADIAPPHNRPRHHLDLYASDQGAEVERLLSIGATRVGRDYPEDADYVVLADPEGNRFCVVQI